MLGLRVSERPGAASRPRRINKAIELNGAAVKMNQAAFLWGRRAAVDSTAVERLIAPKEEVKASTGVSHSLDEIGAAPRGVSHRLSERRVRATSIARWWIRRARRKRPRPRASRALSEAVARYYFKLMAYKDEYEVARLYTESGFAGQDRVAVRGRLQAALPSGAAAAGQAQRERRTDQVRVRALGVRRFQAAGEAAWSARNSTGRLRLHRRAAYRAAVDSKITREC